jgi:hypothetical protein
MIDLCLAGRRNRPSGNVRSTPVDDFVAVLRDEFVQHVFGPRPHIPHDQSVRGGTAKLYLFEVTGVFHIAQAAWRAKNVWLQTPMLTCYSLLS